jgi:hypothetical protein
MQMWIWRDGAFESIISPSVFGLQEPRFQLSRHPASHKKEISLMCLWHQERCDVGIGGLAPAEALRLVLGRGTYALPGRQQTPQQRIIEACKRVPHAVICLFSALWFHGLIAEEPEAVWMTIDKKARTPRVDSPPIKFVFASGDALAQGVVTLGLIDEVQIRVYSPMKTVADCFKYADKIGTEVGPAALAVSVANNKYNRQRLLRFAEICRVKQAAAACEKARRKPVLVEPPAGEEYEATPLQRRVWDREILAKEVWETPVRQLARKYGVSDIAVRKHCKRWGIALLGRGYWQKIASKGRDTG